MSAHVNRQKANSELCYYPVHDVPSSILQEDWLFFGSIVMNTLWGEDSLPHSIQYSCMRNNNHQQHILTAGLETSAQFNTIQQNSTANKYELFKKS